jgi:hypothetical protein
VEGLSPAGGADDIQSFAHYVALLHSYDGDDSVISGDLFPHKHLLIFCFYKQNL